MRLTRRTLALLFAIEAIGFTFLALTLVDRRLHQLDPVYGVNQWGYRGEARGEKEPREIRIALVGGSSAFEAGTDYGDTLASHLFYELQNAGAPARQSYSVVNLSEPRVGADSYLETLRHYGFLEPDVVCLFDGYDTLAGLPPHARERSLVFRATGYLPILPSRILGRPAWLSDPDGGIADILRDGGPGPGDVSCTGASKTYCAAMADAVRFGLQRRRVVIVASPPSVSSRHLVQQRSLAAALTLEFGRERRFAYLDLGPALDLSNRTNSPDRLRRTVVGNHVIGQRIGLAILKLMAALDAGAVSSRAGGWQ